LTGQTRVTAQFVAGAEVLGSERLTGAALARLTHRCHILECNGDSYRLKDAQRRRKANGGDEPPKSEPK